jgi:hypothetical protein
MAGNQGVASTSPKPLAFMTKLGPLVSIYEPAESKATPRSQTDDAAPRLIVLATWMESRDVHCAKYIMQYQQMYPAARILLTKALFMDIWFRNEHKKKATKHSVPYIRSLIDSGYLSASPAKPEILVHHFSNGGVWAVRFIIEAYRAATGKEFPLFAAIYDSGPGKYDWQRSWNAIEFGVPRGFMRILAWPFLFLLDTWYFIYCGLGGKYDNLLNGNFHNNTDIVHQSNRTYFYSDVDEIVLGKHVVLHSQQARHKGYVVRVEDFKTSAHVAHVRVDSERYWKVVRETWETARK